MTMRSNKIAIAANLPAIYPWVLGTGKEGREQ